MVAEEGPEFELQHKGPNADAKSSMAIKLTSSSDAYLKSSQPREASNVGNVYRLLVIPEGWKLQNLQLGHERDAIENGAS